MRRFAVVLLLVLFASQVLAEDLRMTSWNLLNFPGSTGSQRKPHYRTVLESVDTDLLVCQEVIGMNGLNQFLNDVLNVLNPGAWAAGGFHDGNDSDRALFYRTDGLEELDWGWIDTALRDIDWWRLRYIGSGDEFIVVSMHLKASSGSTNEQLRLLEVTLLREFLDSLPPDLPVIVAGDLNIYYSAEPAYQLMMSAGLGQLIDPIGQSGYWHDNAGYAAIHTQSTRTTSFGGGATGGMDDRFDQILVSDVWMDDLGVEVMPETYTAFGNDGQHFNLPIVYGVNGVVSAEVATALHQSSDHLPVFVSLHFPDLSPVAFLAPEQPALRAWPNPFNPVVNLSFAASGTAPTDLIVYDLAGRQVAEIWRGRTTQGPQEARWQPGRLPSGVYLARLSQGGRTITTTKLVLTK